MSLILLGILNSQVSPAAGGSYDLLESTVLTSSASSVTFTGLGSYSDYKHLQIRAVARTDRTAAVVDAIHFRFNGDSGTSYAKHFLQGNGSSVSSGGNANTTKIEQAMAASSTSGTSVFGAAIIDILDFSSTSKNTTARILSGVLPDSGSYLPIRLDSGVYINTSAITSIQMLVDAGPNFVAGSRFSLMGVK